RSTHTSPNVTWQMRTRGIIRGRRGGLGQLAGAWALNVVEGGDRWKMVDRPGEGSRRTSGNGP
ncbi:MAG: hypothetical protein ACPHRO_15600, partial [Nannocystaceae bacterium]